MTVEELSEEKARKALKAAVNVIHLNISCPFCARENDCISESTMVRDEICEHHILTKLLNDPDDIKQHIFYSNL